MNRKNNKKIVSQDAQPSYVGVQISWSILARKDYNGLEQSNMERHGVPNKVVDIDSSILFFPQNGMLHIPTHGIPTVPTLGMVNPISSQSIFKLILSEHLSWWDNPPSHLHLKPQFYMCLNSFSLLSIMILLIQTEYLILDWNSKNILVRMGVLDCRCHIILQMHELRVIKSNYLFFCSLQGIHLLLLSFFSTVATSSTVVGTNLEIVKQQLLNYLGQVELLVVWYNSQPPWLLQPILVYVHFSSF